MSSKKKDKKEAKAKQQKKEDDEKNIFIYNMVDRQMRKIYKDEFGHNANDHTVSNFSIDQLIDRYSKGMLFWIIHNPRHYKKEESLSAFEFIKSLYCIKNMNYVAERIEKKFKGSPQFIEKINNFLKVELDKIDDTKIMKSKVLDTFKILENYTKESNEFAARPPKTVDQELTVQKRISEEDIAKTEITEADIDAFDQKKSVDMTKTVDDYLAVNMKGKSLMDEAISIYLKDNVEQFKSRNNVEVIKSDGDEPTKTPSNVTAMPESSTSSSMPLKEQIKAAQRKNMAEVKSDSDTTTVVTTVPNPETTTKTPPIVETVDVTDKVKPETMPMSQAKKKLTPQQRKFMALKNSRK